MLSRPTVDPRHARRLGEVSLHQVLYVTLALRASRAFRNATSSRVKSGERCRRSGSLEACAVVPDFVRERIVEHEHLAHRSRVDRAADTDPAAAWRQVERYVTTQSSIGHTAVRRDMRSGRQRRKSKPSALTNTNECMFQKCRMRRPACGAGCASNSRRQGRPNLSAERREHRPAASNIPPRTWSISEVSRGRQ
jgi:hypothetical protein